MVLTEPPEHADETAGGADPDELRAWRFAYAAELGYDVGTAARLAEDRTDLHELERLIRQGCDPQVALHIIA